MIGTVLDNIIIKRFRYNNNPIDNSIDNDNNVFFSNKRAYLHLLI